ALPGDRRAGGILRRPCAGGSRALRAHGTAIRQPGESRRSRRVGARHRLEYGAGWTVIAQWLSGQTAIAPRGSHLDWPFDARYLLLSKRVGSRQRLSVRYDRFRVESRNVEPDGEQSGHGWTVAYMFNPGKSWSLTLEGLRVTSNSYIWVEEQSHPGPVTDTQVQLAVRYALGSAGY